MREETALLFKAEQESRFRIIKFALSLPGKPWSLSRLWSFIRERRALALSKAASASGKSAEILRADLQSAREAIESNTKVVSPIALIRAISRALLKRSARTRSLLLLGALLVIAALYLLLPLIYFALGTFPTTSAVKELFFTPVVSVLLTILQILGLVFVAVQIFFFYRLLRPMLKLTGGQNLAAYLLGGLVSQGAFVVGMTAILLASGEGGLHQVLLSGFHISDAALGTIALDLILLFLALIFFLGLLAFLGVGAVTEFILNAIFTLIDTGWTVISDINKSRQEHDLDFAERFDLVLAIIGVILLPLKALKLLEGLEEIVQLIDSADLLSKSFGILAEVYTAEYSSSSPFRRLNRLDDIYQLAESGDYEYRSNQPEQALSAYHQAVKLSQQVQAGPLTQATMTLRVAQAKQAQGDVDGALQAYQQALESYKRAHANPVVLADIQKIMGDLQARKGNFQAAIEAYKSALQTYKSAGADSSRISEVARLLDEVSKAGQ